MSKVLPLGEGNTDGGRADSGPCKEELCCLSAFTCHGHDWKILKGASLARAVHLSFNQLRPHRVQHKYQLLQAFKESKESNLHISVPQDQSLWRKHNQIMRLTFSA